MLYFLKRCWWRACRLSPRQSKRPLAVCFCLSSCLFASFSPVDAGIPPPKAVCHSPCGSAAAWSLYPRVSLPLLGELSNGCPPGLLKSWSSASLKVVIKGTAGWWAGKWDLCWWNWEETDVGIALWQLLFFSSFFSFFYCIVHISRPWGGAWKKRFVSFLYLCFSADCCCSETLREFGIWENLTLSQSFDSIF